MSVDTDEKKATDDVTADGTEPGQDSKTDDGANTITQAEHDRQLNEAVHNAIHKTNTEVAEKLKLEIAQAEQKRLEEAGEHQQLYTDARAKIEKLEAENTLNAFRLEAKALLSSKGLNNHDSLIGETTSIATVTERADQYLADVSEAVESGIRKRLDTGKDTVPTHNSDAKEKEIEAMTPEQWAAHKKTW